MDDEPQTVDERPRNVFVASLNPWRVDDEATRTYVDGDGTRLDPLTPSSSDDLFADADAPVPVAEESDVEIGNIVETTKQGAEFVGLELPSDERDDYVAMNWREAPDQDWGKETNLAPLENYEMLDFQQIKSIASDEFLGNTLMNDGRPTYEPNELLGRRQFENSSADTDQSSQETPAKVALNPEDSTERPAMTPVERIQPGVAFIPSGYRRGGVVQASGSGSMGRVSTIAR